MARWLNKIKLNNSINIILRNATGNDAEKMVEYLNNVGGESDNLLFGKNEFHLTLQEERDYLKKAEIDPNTLMLIGTINDSIVCVAQISNSTRKRIAHNSEISISVKKEYWNAGIGSAVMEELIKYARNKGSIKNICLGVRAGNDNAVKLYEKYGFVTSGVHKNNINVNGTFYDEILMDLNLS